jgi:glycosyltransferase involved in cell wall biosynthesis
MKKEFNFVAPYIAADGYGQAGCQILLGLDRIGWDIWPIHVWAQYSNEDYLPARALELCERPFVPKDICLYFCPPMADIGPQGRSWGRQKLINFTMFETTKIPESWPERMNKLDEIWTPSEWGKEVFENCGVTVPIKVVNLGIEDERVKWVKRDKEPFVYLWMANNSNDNRKNIQMVIAAWVELFGNKPNLPVELWIKTRMGMNSGWPKDDRVAILAGECDNVMMQEIVNKANCFVFPSRGEGWGSPPLEAMATGCPTILTDWSGMTEYIDEDICYPLKVKELVHIPRNTGDYPIGFFGPDVGYWAEPDYEHLKYLMLHVYNNYDEAIEKGKNAHNVIKKKFTYSSVCLKIDTRLKQLMGVK